MKLLKIIILFSLFVFLCVPMKAQKPRILLDGIYDDWQNRTYTFSDKSGDGRFGYDLTQLTIENDESYIYFYFDLGIEVNLQDFNDLALILDTDNNDQTGYNIDGIGAELIYYFGERGGFLYQNNYQYNIGHDDIGLITIPTVSSDRFEIAINYIDKIRGFDVFTSNKIRCILLQDVQNGDKIPDDQGGITFDFSSENLAEVPTYSIMAPEESDFRIMSFNVLKDRWFSTESPFKRQIISIAPDILAFQEIYNHSSVQVREKIENYFGGNWFSAKQGNDIILVSRFPILESHYISGNGAFLLEKDGKPILVINAHLPCCDNDSGRQEEVDAIMKFVRDAKNGNSNLNLADKTPIIILGDMNFVGKNRQIETFSQGDINNEFLYGSDFNPDWDDSGLKDVLSFATQTPHAFTWYDLYSSYNPGRLDYIFYTDAVLELNNAFNLFTGSLTNDTLITYSLLSSDTENASDHLPVVADFSFKDMSSVTDFNVFRENALIAFPSPFKDYFDLVMEEEGNSLSFSIYDSYGNLMLSKRKLFTNKISIDGKNWPKGSYYIYFQQNGRSGIKQIIKME